MKYLVRNLSRNFYSLSFCTFLKRDPSLLLDPNTLENICRKKRITYLIQHFLQKMESKKSLSRNYCIYERKKQFYVHIIFIFILFILWWCSYTWLHSVFEHSFTELNYYVNAFFYLCLFMFYFFSSRCLKKFPHTQENFI